MSNEKQDKLPVESGETVDEALDTFNSIVSDLAIPDPIKKNFLKALDRILCAVIDIPVEWLERGPTEKRAILEERIKFIRAVNAQNIQHIEADPEFARRASRTFTHRILRERLNLEKVFSFVIDIFKKKRYDDSANRQADNEAAETINPDWFNIFEKEASQKSDEDMQRRFAELLAGEIESPGSHSIKAVKALGNMDQKVAELFQKVCSMSVALESSVDMRIIDIRVPSMGRDVGLNQFKEYDLRFGDLATLIEYDLVAPNYNTRNDYQLCILDKKENAANPFRHQGRYWILEPSQERVKKNEFLLDGIQLSSVGLQLFHIVEQIPTQQYTKDLKEFFTKQKLQMVEVFIQHTERGIGWRVIQR